MSSTVLDHQVVGRSRVATQYTESQKFLAYIRALLDSSAELETVLQQVASQTDIDVAEGVNLDAIGEIVGVNRILPSSIAVMFFGFEGQAGATIFGEDGILGIGSRFRDELEPETATSVLADSEYRLLIRAKIVKNHAHGTCEDILAGMAYLFNSSSIVVEDSGGMVIQVAIGRQLTFLEKSLITTLDILPRPGGVRINQRVTYDSLSYFGFDGQLNALVFGEEGSPAIGGLFAEEF
jgi:hypothetical protein